MKSNDEKSLRKVILFISSWVLTALFGIGVLVLLFGSAVYMKQTDPESFDSMMLLLVSILLFAVLWLSLYHLKKKLFIKYTRWALFAGIMMVSAIAVLGMIHYLTQSYATSDPSAAQCTNLATQLRKVQEATIPLATNLGAGTAFAVNDNNTLLTANHVIAGAEEVYVNYVSGKVPVTIIATSPEFDIALLKIEQPTNDHLNLTSKYEVADQLYAYGYPANTFSAGQASLSSGVLSRILSYEDLMLTSDQAPAALEMLQTDAAVNPGNSGGPLVNQCGVVGVIQSISDASQLHEFYGVVSEQGIGYAISSKTAASKFSLPISDK